MENGGLGQWPASCFVKLSPRRTTRFVRGGLRWEGRRRSMSVRVLIVDDSVFVRDVLRHHLECIGCEVIAEAENTLQALDLFRTVSPTLVILDVAVPRTGAVGGPAPFRPLRAQDPDVPVLVATPTALPHIRKSLITHGPLASL